MNTIFKLEGVWFSILLSVFGSEMLRNMFSCKRWKKWQRRRIFLLISGLFGGEVGTVTVSSAEFRRNPSWHQNTPDVYTCMDIYYRIYIKKIYVYKYLYVHCYMMYNIYLLDIHLARLIGIRSDYLFIDIWNWTYEITIWIWQPWTQQRTKYDANNVKIIKIHCKWSMRMNEYESIWMSMNEYEWVWGIR